MSAKRTYGPYYRTNTRITAQEIRLIDEDSKQIGVMSLSDALQKGRETGLDLVEIAPKAKPPVVKLIDFSKFRYQQEKKARQEKKKSKNVDIKEIQMNPTIGDNDFDVRVNRAKKFLTTGNKVKLIVKFRGRQIIHKEFGYELTKKFEKTLSDRLRVENPTKLVGKQLITIFAPTTTHEKTTPTIQN